MREQPFILNLHGVGEAPRPYEKGEKPYWISYQELQAILNFVQTNCSGGILLTVDDGNSSDYEILAPELQRRSMGAIFFVLAGRLDESGYLRRSQLRELAQRGFEIGSHGLYHVDWVNADDLSLAYEVEGSKRILEDVTGGPVTAASVPFGLYDRRVLRALREAGYRRVFSSDGGPRLTTAWPTPRRTLRSGFDVEAVARQIGRRSLHHRVCTELRVVVKSLRCGSAFQPFRYGRR